MAMKIDLVKLKESLTGEDIIKIVTSLGADRYEDNETEIIFPTICHNNDPAAASMKLYYYKNNHKFVCYTECDDSFDIYELIRRALNIQDISCNFYDILNIIESNSHSLIHDFEKEESPKYESKSNKYKRRKDVELEEYNPSVLNVFTHHYPIEWLLEGITPEVMDKYNILYSISQNKIIIPHYDINGRLIGIRGRGLNEEDILNKRKYMPVKIEDKLYNHKLSLNLYGINFNKENIKKVKKVILFEGEKSIYKCENFLNHNYSLAVCGDKINKNQINLLIKNFNLNEIIIAFDKEYKKYPSKEAESYFNKLWGIGEKYSNYCNFSFIFDKDNLLSEKDSPVDCGADTFEKLYKKRIFIK